MPRTRLVAHPLVEGFPIETALRRLVNGNKSTPTVRDLAHAALVGGHSEALWGLHDALAESQHPWENLYNWRAAADKLHLDKVTYEALRDEAERVRRRTAAAGLDMPWGSTPERAAQVAAAHMEPRHPNAPYFGDPRTLATIRQGVKDVLPDVHPDQIDESIRRHAYRGIRRRDALFGIRHDPRPHTAPLGEPGTYPNEHDFLNHKATRYARPHISIGSVAGMFLGGVSGHKSGLNKVGRLLQKFVSVHRDPTVRTLATAFLKGDHTVGLGLQDRLDEIDDPYGGYLNLKNLIDLHQESRAKGQFIGGKAADKAAFSPRQYARSPRPGPFANLRGHPLGQNPDVVRTLYRLWKSTPQIGEAGRPVRALVEGIMRDPWRGTRYSALRARLQDVGHPYGNFPEWDQAAALIGRQKRVKDAVDWLSRAKRIDTTGLGNPTNPDIGGIAERVAAQVGGDVKRRDVLDHFRTFRLNPRQGAISPWAFEHQAHSFRKFSGMEKAPEMRTEAEYGVPEGPFKFRRRRYAAPSNGTFLDALRRASSRQQKGLHEAAKTVVRKLGLAPAQVSPVVHDALRQSTPGVATAVYGGWGNPEAVRSAASWLGLYTRSPGMGVFHVRPAGPDAIYRMRLFGAGNEIRARLDRSGIGQRLLIPHRRGFDVVVPDKGGGQYRAVRAFSEQQGVPMEMSRGHFQTIGANDPGDARAKFRGTIRQQEG